MIPGVLAAASDADWAIITDLVMIFASAAGVAVLMQPMRLAAIPAYLNAGTAIARRALGLGVEPQRRAGSDWGPNAPFRDRLSRGVPYG